MADLPFSFLQLSYTGCLAASLAAVAGIVAWLRRDFHLGAGLTILFSVLAISWAAHNTGEKLSKEDLVISFPDVGQADAAIIRRCGKTVLVDCGPSGLPGKDSPIVRALQKSGAGRIYAVFLSHLHPDHVDGLKDILTKWPVSVIYLPEAYCPEGKRNILPECINDDNRIRYLKRGDRVNVADMIFTVSGPDESDNHLRDLNRGSMQLFLEFKGFCALFTGDAGWDQVVNSLHQTHRLDLFKIPHHGSRDGFPASGLNEAVVRIKKSGGFTAVCPSGPPGKNYLPAPEVVRWFRERGIKLVYTGDKGVNIRYHKGE